MAPTDPRRSSTPGLFGRVATLLSPKSTHDVRAGSTASTRDAEKSLALDANSNGQGRPQDPESPEVGRDWNLMADNLDRRRWARTLPPWIHSFENGENQDVVDPNAYLLPRPPTSRAPHHNYMPIPKPRPGGAASSDGDYPEVKALRASRWAAFARASAFPRTEGSIVDEAWLAENMPDFDRPWTPMLNKEDMSQAKGFWLFTPSKRKATADHLNRVLMRNPFVPLCVRLLVMAFCAASLAIGAWIYHKSFQLNASPTLLAGTDSSGATEDYICEQQASTYMAVVVNSVAVVYLFYIMWDEYFSKPLGLRRTRAKMRLIFLDLFFIVFSAADLSLAFNTLTDQQWSCYSGTSGTLNSNNQEVATTTCVYNSGLCEKQQALVGMLVIAEVAWLLTFTISILRVVERISA